MSNFTEETKDMDSVEILNYYRNLYHCEPNTTEQGIVAWAINDILPTYVNKQEIRAKVIDEAIDEAAKAICIGCGYLDGHKCSYKGGNCTVSKPMLEVVVKALEQMKIGGENE